MFIIFLTNKKRVIAKRKNRVRPISRSPQFERCFFLSLASCVPRRWQFYMCLRILPVQSFDFWGEWVGDFQVTKMSCKQTRNEKYIYCMESILLLFKPKKSGKNIFDHKRRLEKCSFPCLVTHYPVKSQRVGSWRKWDTTRILWLITIWQRPCNKEQNFHGEYRQTCHVCKANKNRTCLDIRYVIY